MLLNKVFSDYKRIENLCPQFSLSVIDHCKKVGIKTVLDFVLHDVEELAKKISTPYKVVSLIHHFLLSEYSAFPQRGDSFYEISLQTALIVRTGSVRLDDFLNGGIYSREITEIHGPSGAGKTQFCFSIASSFLMQKMCVLYLDTSNSFSIKRMSQILHFRLNDDPELLNQPVEEMLQNLEVINVNDVYQLFDVLHMIEDCLQKQNGHYYQNLKLIIVDSITHLLAPCLTNPQAGGQGLMMSVAQQLKRMAQKKNLCVLNCNNAVRGVGSGIKPALGLSWKYVPSVTLFIIKADTGPEFQKLRKIVRVKSCRNKILGETFLAISEAGISD